VVKSAKAVVILGATMLILEATVVILAASVVILSLNVVVLAAVIVEVRYQSSKSTNSGGWDSPTKYRIF